MKNIGYDRDQELEFWQWRLALFQEYLFTVGKFLSVYGIAPIENMGSPYSPEFQMTSCEMPLLFQAFQIVCDPENKDLSSRELVRKYDFRHTLIPAPIFHWMTFECRH